MKKFASMVLALVVLAGLCVGCAANDTDAPTESDITEPMIGAVIGELQVGDSIFRPYRLKMDTEVATPVGSSSFVPEGEKAFTIYMEYDKSKGGVLELFEDGYFLINGEQSEILGYMDEAIDWVGFIGSRKADMDDTMLSIKLVYGDQFIEITTH